MLRLYHFLGRLSRCLPKHKMIQYEQMKADFIIPFHCHYICDDLLDIVEGRREPHLYQWLNRLPNNAVYFDVGTSYGQEVALASSFVNRGIKVVGFDCNLHHSHFCCVNRALNDNSFDFVFAAISDVSGVPVVVTTNSDVHIPHLHKKNVPYSYTVLSLSLDDYVKNEGLFPTHLKIDVDGAEADVIRGAKYILSDFRLKEIFIEIDHNHTDLTGHIQSCGLEIIYQHKKELNSDILFRRK